MVQNKQKNGTFDIIKRVKVKFILTKIATKKIKFDVLCFPMITMLKSTANLSK